MHYKFFFDSERSLNTRFSYIFEPKKGGGGTQQSLEYSKTWSWVSVVRDILMESTKLPEKDIWDMRTEEVFVNLMMYYQKQEVIEAEQKKAREKAKRKQNNR